MMLTLEQIRELIIARLTDGTGPALCNEQIECMYRTPNGLGCAVGCLIPEEFYNPQIEKAGIHHLQIKDGKWAGGVRSYTKIKYSKLAETLNLAGIPATEEVKEELIKWQFRHDNPHNWSTENPNVYVGQLD